MMCPHCGRPVELVKRGLSATTLSDVPMPMVPMMRSEYTPFESLTQRYESTAPFPWADKSTAPEQDWKEWERKEPVRTPTWEGDVRVPLAQSLVCGTFACVLSVPVIILKEWPWWCSLMAGTVVAAGFWGVFLNQHRSLLWRVEKILNRDFDGDGHKGDPVQHEYIIKEERADGSANWQMIAGMPLDPEKLRSFARGCLAGQTGTASWTGRTGIMSRGEYDQVRDRLISGGFARWSPSGKNHGWELTAKGRAWFSALSEEG